MFDVCFILAGGRGERLRPLTDRTPKPLIAVDSKSIIEHQIDYLHARGIQNFVLLTGYKSTEFEILIDRYRERSHIRVRSLSTPEEWLTLQRLYAHRSEICGDALILYGDNYAEVDLSFLYKRFKYRANTAESLSVLAGKRQQSKSSSRTFKEDIGAFNPYHDIRETSVDIGFFCIKGSILKDLLEKSKDVLDQRFEDWYFQNDDIERSYVPYFWNYLSITDLDSLNEARNALGPGITLFIDRDGVLVSSRSRSKYIDRKDDMLFNDVLLRAIRSNRDKIRHIGIVTNQAWAGPFIDIYKNQASYVEEHLQAKAGIESVSTHTCCHKIDERCCCRKPKPGLILQSINMSKYPILPSRARFIGDSSSDEGVARHMMLEYIDIRKADSGTIASWFQH